MDERRREVRKKLMAFKPVFDEMRGVVLGYLGNLTMQGAMVISEKPLDINSSAVLHIEFLDELPNSPMQRLVIPARVARCVRDDESAHDYNIGFEFSEPSPAQSQLIQEMLDRYYYRYGEADAGKT